MLRSVGNQFRTAQNPNSYGVTQVSLGDITGPVAGTTYASYTTGATLIDPGGLQPPALARWKIVSYSIRAGLIAVSAPGSGSASGVQGKLSKILAGLTNQPTTNGQLGGAFPWSQALNLPQDTSLVGDLWDPAVHDMPPITKGTGLLGGQVPMQIALAQVLPTPLPVTAGGQVNVGLWLEPMLLQNLVMAVIGAEFIINYDDGLPEPAPGGGGGMRPPAP